MKTSMLNVYMFGEIKKKSLCILYKNHCSNVVIMNYKNMLYIK